MADDVRIHFDTREFSNVFRRYIELNKREIPRLLNNKAYRIVMHYVQLVKRAARGDIEALGIIGYKFSRSRKTGLTKQSRRAGSAIVGDRSRARAIVVSQKRADGSLSGSSGEEIQDLARKLISNRLRAIGYLASAGLPILRIFGNAVNKSQRPMGARDVRTYGAPKGFGVVATKDRPEAIIEMRPVIDNSENAARHIDVAFRQGYQLEIADMEQYIQRKIEQNGRRAGARVA